MCCTMPVDSTQLRPTMEVTARRHLAGVYHSWDSLVRRQPCDVEASVHPTMLTCSTTSCMTSLMRAR